MLKCQYFQIDLGKICLKPWRTVDVGTVYSSFNIFPDSKNCNKLVDAIKLDHSLFRQILASHFSPLMIHRYSNYIPVICSSTSHKSSTSLNLTRNVLQLFVVHITWTKFVSFSLLVITKRKYQPLYDIVRNQDRVQKYYMFFSCYIYPRI